MHDHSCWWEVKPLHNNIGIFNIKYLKNLIPLISLLEVSSRQGPDVKTRSLAVRRTAPDG